MRGGEGEGEGVEGESRVREGDWGRRCRRPAAAQGGGGVTLTPVSGTGQAPPSPVVGDRGLSRERVMGAPRCPAHLDSGFRRNDGGLARAT